MTNKRTYVFITEIQLTNILKWSFGPASDYPLSECAIFTRIVGNGNDFQWIRLGKFINLTLID